MADLGYPTDAVALVGNIYSHSTTSYVGEYFGKTKPIPIQRGTIQGDTLSPYLIIIFLEKLLRWMQRGNNGYTVGTSNTTINLANLANQIKSLQIQMNKVDKFCEWSGMDVGVPKCAITGCPNKSKMNPTAFKAHLQINNVKYRNQPIPALHQNESYIYLGTSLVPTLKWKLQIHNTTTKSTKQCQKFSHAPPL